MAKKHPEGYLSAKESRRISRENRKITGQYEKFAGSYSYAIPTGTQGSITNWINEKGGTEARLVMSRISYSRLDTSGVWSPDSTRNYTIFG